jgi:hypothetical protein
MYLQLLFFPVDYNVTVIYSDPQIISSWSTEAPSSCPSDMLPSFFEPLFPGT